MSSCRTLRIGGNLRGHDDIIELLNEVLTAELTSINQIGTELYLSQQLHD